MQKYEYSTDGETWQVFHEMSEIEQELEKLTLGNADIFLVEAIPPIAGVVTLQADGVKIRRGIFKKREVGVEHAIEVLIGDLDEIDQIFRYTTEDFKELYNIFENFITYQKIPAYELWEDFTHTAFWKNQTK